MDGGARTPLDSRDSVEPRSGEEKTAERATHGDTVGCTTKRRTKSEYDSVDTPGRFLTRTVSFTGPSRVGTRLM